MYNDHRVMPPRVTAPKQRKDAINLLCSRLLRVYSLWNNSIKQHIISMSHVTIDRQRERGLIEVAVIAGV